MSSSSLPPTSFYLTSESIDQLEAITETRLRRALLNYEPNLDLRRGSGMAEKVGVPEGRTSIFKWIVMPFLLLFGFLAAMAQHLFYPYIDGLSPEECIVEQRWVIRIGTRP